MVRGHGIQFNINPGKLPMGALQDWDQATNQGDSRIEKAVVTGVGVKNLRIE
jgi:hypothetical protein